jgi:hypothetical protein
MAVPPLVNNMVPTAPGDGLTVAVNVTGAPAVEGLRPDVSAVVVEVAAAVAVKLTDTIATIMRKYTHNL